MTLRYVPEALEGEESMRVALGRASLGREEITLGVRICCWVYVYSSGGRRSQADRSTYEQKNRQQETRTTVRSRTAVAHKRTRRGESYYQGQHRVETAVRVA